MPDAIGIDFDPDIFNEIYIPWFKEYARTQIVYGGSGSGKSVFIAQRTVVDILDGGRNYLVCRKVARTIRGSVFTEICKVITEWGLLDYFNINKTDMLITCQNGYQIIFFGLDDMEKLKSIVPVKGAITDIWIEEATEIEYDDYKLLKKRQRGGSEGTKKRITMTFNPILQTNWIYREFFGKISWSDNQTEYHGSDLSILKTWYIHNKFLTKDDIKDYEDETDKYYHDVYTLGNWGILGDVIFSNWKVADLTEMRNQFTNRKNGLDFGFSSDPAAMANTHYDSRNKIIYVFDELYERGLTNDLLADEIKKRIGQDRVICDSAEPKSIKELCNHGVTAASAIKGKDSVIYGIQWLQQQEIIIDPKCINARNEISTYHWKKDKDGNSIREPVDKNNHFIDALRYAYEDEAGGGLWLVS